MNKKESEKSKLIEKTEIKEVNKKEKFSFLSFLQKIGKSLVFPIAVLPAAALALRIGDAISSAGEQYSAIWWFGWIIETPGSIVFDNLPMIFGVGVAFGLAKDHRGEAAMVGLIGYLGLVALVQNEHSLSSLIYDNVLTKDGYSQLLYYVTEITDPLTGETEIYATWLLNLGVFGGIAMGLIAAWLYNKYSDIKLPKALGFFSGRRFVPMAMLLVVVAFSFLMAIIWPWFQLALVELAYGLLYIPWLGSGIYVGINRLLIPTGLHQVLNVFFWFQMPITWEGNQIFILQTGIDGSQSFVPLFGDINAFLEAGSDVTIMIPGVTSPDGVSGDEAFKYLQEANVGAFQVGFFPIMMFGLPAVGLAIASQSESEYRKSVYAFMISAGAVSFLTGITEPLEFSFMFVSPLLYLFYSILSGIVASITVATGASFGFGFSAGVIDFGLSVPNSLNLSHGISEYANGWGGVINVLLIGLIVAPIYYFMTIFMIKKFNLATPGRGGNVSGIVDLENENEEKKISNKEDKYFKMAIETIKIVGKDNITDVDNCITRLRLSVRDNSKVKKEDAIKIGYTGLISPGKKALQFIIGPESEIIAKNIKQIFDDWQKYQDYFVEQKQKNSEGKNKEND
ncbi:MAG: hypothetical protein HPPSJP_0040 [Candidatus Hepatoplasma scabrum]|nr:MAG: hypothetical protein HPPSJP_0040 [Candidatus Hepatoplasma sp.]